MRNSMNCLACSLLLWVASGTAVMSKPEEKPELRAARAKFQLYLDKRPSAEADQALLEAAIAWANSEGASAQVEELVRRIPLDDDVWHTVLIGFGNAFGRDGRYDQGMELLTELEPQISPIPSRCAVLLTLATLARYWHSRGMTAKAVQAYERILNWTPSRELSEDARRA